MNYGKIRESFSPMSLAIYSGGLIMALLSWAAQHTWHRVDVTERAVIIQETRIDAVEKTTNERQTEILRRFDRIDAKLDRIGR